MELQPPEDVNKVAGLSRFPVFQQERSDKDRLNKETPLLRSKGRHGWREHIKSLCPLRCFLSDVLFSFSFRSSPSLLRYPLFTITTRNQKTRRRLFLYSSAFVSLSFSFLAHHPLFQATYFQPWQRQKGQNRRSRLPKGPSARLR